eukprot:CAMPEP_0119396040 /NCGR_PEP_ID=MMETSP1334-20130426/135450_1 /TAXON_ID=127549 /ORGANISM="Calcidiscus leptoporus, Strain RCC1130" /LENGTH=79 /DNA_ID=CAMNT_0007419633 /DNA_START=49 /DNA_END=284 /DNA_ORIENTATION=-
MRRVHNRERGKVGPSAWAVTAPRADASKLVVAATFLIALLEAVACVAFRSHISAFLAALLAVLCVAGLLEVTALGSFVR